MQGRPNERTSTTQPLKRVNFFMTCCGQTRGDRGPRGGGQRPCPACTPNHSPSHTLEECDNGARPTRQPETEHPTAVALHFTGSCITAKSSGIKALRNMTPLTRNGDRDSSRASAWKICSIDAICSRAKKAIAQCTSRDGKRSD